MCNNIAMEKIGVFGGTFNPVHKEHVTIAKIAIEALSLDKLIIMPTFMPPHKNGIPAPVQDRIKMLELAFSGVDGVEISDMEAKRQGKSYTYQTLECIAQKETGAKLFFIVGADMLVDFKTWRNPDRILSLATLCCFGREKFNVDYQKEREYFQKTFGKEFVTLPYDGGADCSTAIRIYASLGISLTDMVSEDVEKYIKEKALYSGGKIEEFLKESLTKKRLLHTARVTVCALRRAKEFGVDEKKITTACLIHDCAKYLSYKSFADFTLPDGVPEPVIHSFLGAYVAKEVLGVDDEEILDAVRYHTSGKANMSNLGKLLFVADMVEDGRNYDGVEELRKAFESKSLDECFKACLKEEMIHLLNKGGEIFVETKNAYDYYIGE